MTTPSSGAIDPERRGALLGAKLRGLVALRWGPDPDGYRVTGRFPGGATLLDPVGARAWVLAEDDGSRALGPALAWAWANAADLLDGGEVHLVVVDPAAAGVVARRAALFTPQLTVWAVSGTSLSVAGPAPHHVPAEGPGGVESLVALLEAHGLDALVEHGAVIGEWLGLELARVVIDPETGPRLDVGVGRNDREAFAMVHGDLPAPDALRQVLASVEAQRRPTRADSPISRLSRQRWLRRELIARPDLVGAARLAPVEATVAPQGVKDTAAAMAVGVDGQGAPLLVACSVGIDVDAVPAAADARLAYCPDGALVVAVPERDRHPLTERLAASLRHPASVAVVPVPWEG